MKLRAFLLLVISSIVMSYSAAQDNPPILYFIAEHQGNIGDAETNALWRVEAEADVAEVLVTWRQNLYCEQFSNDGSFFLYTTYAADSTIDNPKGDAAIYFVETGESISIYEDKSSPYACPQISPDNAYIAYFIEYGMYVYDIANQAVIEVTAGLDYSARAALATVPMQWLSDSSGLVFDSSKEGIATIFFYHLQSQNLLELFAANGPQLSYRLAPQSHQMAYAISRSMADSLYEVGILQLDTAEKTIIFEGSLNFSASPIVLSWSPDENHLVYSLDGQAGNQISIYGRETGESLSFPVYFRANNYPQWLDNERFFFQNGEGLAMSFVNRQTGQNEISAWMNYSHSPSGNLAAYIENAIGKNLIRIVDLASSAERHSIEFNTADPFQLGLMQLPFAWSDDSLYYAVAYETQLTVVNTETGSKKDLVPMDDDILYKPLAFVWR